jgi:hypothetical protein
VPTPRKTAAFAKEHLGLSMLTNVTQTHTHTHTHTVYGVEITLKGTAITVANNDGDTSIHDGRR